MNYGKPPDVVAKLRADALAASRPYGVRELSRASGVSLGATSNFVHGGETTEETLQKILAAIPKLEVEHRQRTKADQALLDRARRRRDEDGLRRLAEIVDVDPGYLSRVLAGLRPLRRRMREQLEVLMGSPAGTRLR